jgi:hypothetical protein
MGVGFLGTRISRDRELTRQGQGCHGIGYAKLFQGNFSWDIGRDEVITDLLGYRFLTGQLYCTFKGHTLKKEIFKSAYTHCIVINRTF